MAMAELHPKRARSEEDGPSCRPSSLEQRVLERLASGEPSKSLRCALPPPPTLPVLAAMLRKKWIARETAAAERDARRTERFAVLVPDARLPGLTEKQQAILAELAANGGELPLAELRARESCRRQHCRRWYVAVGSH